MAAAACAYLSGDSYATGVCGGIVLDCCSCCSRCCCCCNPWSIPSRNDIDLPCVATLASTMPCKLSRAAETAEWVSAADINDDDEGSCRSPTATDAAHDRDASFSRISASYARSSLCRTSMALSTPSGSQYSAHAHSVFPSGETSKPPSLYSKALGTNVRGCVCVRVCQVSSTAKMQREEKEIIVRVCVRLTLYSKRFRDCNLQTTHNNKNTNNHKLQLTFAMARRAG